MNSPMPTVFDQYSGVDAGSIGAAIPIVFLAIAGFIAVTAIILTNVAAMVKATARERTRRELAAYVAEGTMKPEDADRILSAGEAASGEGEKRCACGRRRKASAEM